METSSTDSAPAGSPQKPPLDLSLRLWSDKIPLGAIVNGMKVAVSHLYVLAEPMATAGRFAGRLATHHYAAICEKRCNSDNEVNTWLNGTLGGVESQNDLAAFLLDGNVWGEIWIVRLYGEDDLTMPNIDSELVDRAILLNLSIFMENYTSFDDDGAPAKRWISVRRKRADQLEAGAEDA